MVRSLEGEPQSAADWVMVASPDRLARSGPNKQADMGREVGEGATTTVPRS
jgi:hypothetical protein